MSTYDGETQKLRYPHLAKEPLVTSRKRGNVENRLWAKVVDFAFILPVLYFLEIIFPTLVLPASLLIWAVIDSMGRGQSPGKWLLGLHTIEVQKGESPKLYNGLIRNFLFALLAASLVKSGMIWSLVMVLSFVLGAMEAYFVFILRSGIRVGDILSYTRVFDYKDVHTQFIEQFLKKEENN